MSKADLLNRLRRGDRNTRTIKFPGEDEDVLIRVLTESQIRQAEFSTEQMFKAGGIEYASQTVDAYEKEKTVQMLALALRDPDDPAKPLFKNAAELAETITAEEKSTLVMEYEALQQDCSPVLENMGAEEFSTLIDELKKTPDSVSNVSSISLLQRLVRTLAARPASSRTDSGP